MRKCRALAISTSFLMAITIAQACADDQPTKGAATSPSDNTDMPVYNPPVGRGAPVDRIGGASRGSDAPGDTRLDVVAPDQLGFTAREQPTLYWFLSAPINKPVEVMISVGNAEKPAYDAVLPGPVAAGFHPVSLSQLGVKIQPGVDYEWTVAIILDPQARSKDLFATAHVERSERPPPPSDAQSATRTFAAAGLWYDAIDAATADIARDPGNAQHRHALAALLRQVQLDDAAKFAEAAQGKPQ
jgi:hypothetical protein